MITQFMDPSGDKACDLPSTRQDETVTDHLIIQTETGTKRMRTACVGGTVPAAAETPACRPELRDVEGHQEPRPSAAAQWYRVGLRGPVGSCSPVGPVVLVHLVDAAIPTIPPTSQRLPGYPGGVAKVRKPPNWPRTSVCLTDNARKKTQSRNSISSVVGAEV